MMAPIARRSTIGHRTGLPGTAREAAAPLFPASLEGVRRSPTTNTSKEIDMAIGIGTLILIIILLIILL